jgi:hypothetical protein
MCLIKCLSVLLLFTKRPLPHKQKVQHLSVKKHLANTAIAQTFDQQLTGLLVSLNNVRVYKMSVGLIIIDKKARPFPHKTRGSLSSG